MDLISIDDLVFTGIHGVHKKEKKQSQRFGVSIAVSYDAHAAATSDQIGDAVDYSPIRDLIREVIETHSYNLIETIATVIADRVLGDGRIQSVRITIRKLDLWGNGVPSLTLVRP